MAGYYLEGYQLIKGLDPIADAFAGTVNSDVVNVKGLSRVLFIVYAGVGATGTSTFTVEACDDVTPTNTTAVAYQSRMILTGDTEGAVTARTTAGFIPTAGSSKIILFEVKEQDLAASGYGYVRLHAVESVNDPVLGGILVIGEAKDARAIKATAIV